MSGGQISCNKEETISLRKRGSGENHNHTFVNLLTMDNDQFPFTMPDYGWDNNDEVTQKSYYESSPERPKPKKRPTQKKRKPVGARKKKAKKKLPIPPAFAAKTPSPQPKAKPAPKKPPHRTRTGIPSTIPRVKKVTTKKPKVMPVARPKPTKLSRAKRASHPPTPKYNNDGYPMKECQFEITEERFVYRPPGYLDGCVPPRAGSFHVHCCDCHLMPCITTKYHEEVTEWISMAKILEFNNNDLDLHAADAVKILETHRCKVFGAPYDVDKQPPPCITDYASHMAHLDPEGDSEDEDDSVLDDFPYSLMRDRQVGDPPLRDLLQMYHSKQAPPRPGLWTRFDHSFFNEKNKQQCTYKEPNDSSNPYPPRTSPTKTSKGSSRRRVHQSSGSSRRVSLDPPQEPQGTPTTASVNKAVASHRKDADSDEEMEWSWRPNVSPSLCPKPYHSSLSRKL